MVSAVERDDVTAEQTSFRANEKLLLVLSRKSPQQFQLFLDALSNCGQQHVRNVIAADQRGLFVIVEQQLVLSFHHKGTQFDYLAVCLSHMLQEKIFFDQIAFQPV